MPIGVSFSTAPVMPTTTTRSTGVASRRRSVASVASLVPIPVTMATTSRPSSVPRWTVTPSISVLLSDSFLTRGDSSIGMAQMNAMRSGLLRSVHPASLPDPLRRGQACRAKLAVVDA